MFGIRLHVSPAIRLTMRKTDWENKNGTRTHDHKYVIVIRFYVMLSESASLR